MWFRSMRQRRTGARGLGRPTSHRPQLERLEDRCLLSAGGLDPSFGSGGIVTTAAGRANATAVQSDGKILVAGQAYSRNDSALAVVRYTPSGTLDPTFGSGGIVTTKGLGSAYSMAVYPDAGTSNDGKIVVAGGQSDFTLARYNRNGSLDTSFGRRGTMTTDFGFTEYGTDVVIQPDGKTLVVGQSSFSQGFLLARYNANGTLDTSFGSGGKVVSTLGGNPGAEGVALQADGRIVVAGFSNASGSGPRFTVARYGTNGSLDLTFGDQHAGYVALTLGSDVNNSRAFSVAVQPDGKIVATGWGNHVTASGPYHAWALVRFNSDGGLDPAFGNGGIVSTVLTGTPAEDDASSMALQTDGRIVVAGTHDYGSAGSFALGRYNTDGSLDTTFNGTGIVITPVGGASIAWDMAIQPADGKIVVAGQVSASPNSSFVVARYLGDSSQSPFGAAAAQPAATTLPTQWRPRQGRDEAIALWAAADFSPARVIDAQAPGAPTPPRLWDGRAFAGLASTDESDPGEALPGLAQALPPLRKSLRATP